jgi:hypothetical protein
MAEDLNSLRPCERCRSRKFWLDGDEWLCFVCVPPPIQNIITVEINEAQSQGETDSAPNHQPRGPRKLH